MSKNYLIISGFLILLAACTPKIPDALSVEDFTQTNVNPTDIFSTISFFDKPIHAIEGRARAQMSGPGYSEQGTVTFVSDRHQSLLAMRNSLGIEGGRMYADRDSVTIYDRIEQRAWKIDVNESHLKLLNGFTAFNVLNFLVPEVHADNVEAVLQNENLWLILFENGSSMFIQKKTGRISEMVIESDDPKAFNRFLFQNHAMISGIDLPRRIQVLSNDGKSNIFLLIQALEVNPTSPNYDMQLPDGILIER